MDLSRYDALGYDPQTAGGLPSSAAADKAAALEAAFEAKHLFLRRVGLSRGRIAAFPRSA
jgi:hypothetical protein